MDTNVQQFVEHPAIQDGRIIIRPTLQNVNPPPPPAPVLNRRDLSPMGMSKPVLSDQSIPMGEALLRIGGAGLEGAAQGGLQSLGAMTDTYGQIQDYNRSQALAQYNAAVDQYNKEQSLNSLDKYRQGLLEEKEAKRQAAAQTAPPTDIYTKPVLTAIDSIMEKVTIGASDWWPQNNVTGLIGSVLSNVPGTAAHDVMMDIQTLKSAIGFDRLQAMRDASPTGGALGQVSEKELAQLNASLGSLEQSQTREQFIERLQAVKTHYINALAAIRRQQAAYQQMQADQAAPQQQQVDAAAMLSEADALTGFGQ